MSIDLFCTQSKKKSSSDTLTQNLKTYLLITILDLKIISTFSNANHIWRKLVFIQSTFLWYHWIPDITGMILGHSTGAKAKILEFQFRHQDHYVFHFFVLYIWKKTETIIINLNKLYTVSVASMFIAYLQPNLKISWWWQFSCIKLCLMIMGFPIFYTKASSIFCQDKINSASAVIRLYRDFQSQAHNTHNKKVWNYAQKNSGGE